LDHICEDCKIHFEGLKSELTALEIPFVVDPHIVRGLDYYTRTVFEIISEGIGAQSTVCGGGRYNNLIKECGGQDTPAVGFGLGIERLIITLEANGGNIPEPYGPTLFIAALGDGAKHETSKLIFALRNAGISCEKDLMSRNLKGQLKYANKIKSKFAIVIGDEELNTNNVKLKNMDNGEEIQIQITNIIEEVKSRI
jgi:histidyl-tRNA synthetase